MKEEEVKMRLTKDEPRGTMSGFGGEADVQLKCIYINACSMDKAGCSSRSLEKCSSRISPCAVR